MVIKTYLDKVNTIIKDSSLNTGLNPISELIYGANLTRMLIHFNLDDVKTTLEQNGVFDLSNVKHILKMTNCGTIEKKCLFDTQDSMVTEGIKLRSSSFDLIFFLIPQEWDEGKGFDYNLTYFNQGYNFSQCCSLPTDTSKLISTDGCNWFQARNGYKWDEEGVYDNQTLSIEYDNFSSESGSTIIIARQHFDKGAENISVDISDVVNKFIKGDLMNYGIGVAYTPMTELNEDINENYISFFTNYTNSFFEPFLETSYDDTILDDRNNFILNKKNRLYLYANIGGILTNLDELPTCEINGILMDVKQASEGVYYVELMLSSNDYQDNIMLYDLWSNIKYKGITLNNVELDFVTKSPSIYFNIGNNIQSTVHFKPLLSGIQYNEKILRGDRRKINVVSKQEYQRNIASIVDDMEYRLYVKDGEREITVIEYQKIHRTFNENYFIIDTKMLVPQKYYIDVKYKYNLENIINKNCLSFEIINDVSQKYFS